MQQRAAAAIEVLTHAIDASKRVMHNLRPAILEQGLVAALQWMASNFETPHRHRLPPAQQPRQPGRCRRACRWWPTGWRRRR